MGMGIGMGDGDLYKDTDRNAVGDVDGNGDYDRNKDGTFIRTGTKLDTAHMSYLAISLPPH